MEIQVLFQRPYMKLRSVTPLAWFVLFAMFTMGVIHVDSMWLLCMDVHDHVLSHPEYSWMTIGILWSAISTTMFQAILLGELVVIVSTLHITFTTIIILTLQQYVFQFK